jgi:hypothetical protein
MNLQLESVREECPEHLARLVLRGRGSVRDQSVDVIESFGKPACLMDVTSNPELAGVWAVANTIPPTTVMIPIAPRRSFTIRTILLDLPLY